MHRRGKEQRKEHLVDYLRINGNLLTLGYEEIKPIIVVKLIVVIVFAIVFKVIFCPLFRLVFHAINLNGCIEREDAK